jgi:hypothetical protein
MYFPVWYQVEKRGFVDFNFAYYHTGIVEFWPAPPPQYRDLEWLRTMGGWYFRPGDIERYRYFFVRRIRPLPQGLFAMAKCQPVVVASNPSWELFETVPCVSPRTKRP